MLSVACIDIWSQMLLEVPGSHCQLLQIPLGSSRFDTTRSTGRPRPDERVEPCCSTTLTQPRPQDVTWRANWNLGFIAWLPSVVMVARDHPRRFDEDCSVCYYCHILLMLLLNVVLASCDGPPVKCGSVDCTTGKIGLGSELVSELGWLQLELGLRLRFGFCLRQHQKF